MQKKRHPYAVAVILLAVLNSGSFRDSEANVYTLGKALISELVSPGAGKTMLLEVAKKNNTNIRSIIGGNYSIVQVKSPAGNVYPAYSNGNIMLMFNSKMGKFNLLSPNDKRLIYVNHPEDIKLSLIEILRYKNPTTFRLANAHKNSKRNKRSASDYVGIDESMLKKLEAQLY